MNRDESRAGFDQSPRRKPARYVSAWISGYLAVGTLTSLFLLSQGDAQLRTGRFVESLPAAILLIAAIVTFVLVAALRRSEQPYLAWLGLAVLCVVLIGEEAKWGHEPVMGVQVLHGDGWDLHNRAAFRYLPAISPVDLESMAGVALVSVLGAIAATAVVVYLVKRLWQRRLDMPAAFLLVALAFAIVGLSIDVLDLATEEFFMNRVGIVKWALEEMAEIMASAALLFAPLVRITTVSDEPHEARSTLRRRS